VKRASGAAGIVPAIGTAATHLAFDHDAVGPGPMSLMAILACAGRLLSRDVGKESFHVAPADKI
jgi:hypothetical protein